MHFQTLPGIGATLPVVCNYKMPWEVYMGDWWNTILCPLLIMVLLGLSGCGLIFKQIPPGGIYTPVPGAQDRFIKVGEVNYHYAEYPADGEDILMVHGFASSTYSWQKVAPLLQKKGYHVWTFDMKGFGWSDKPKGARYDAHTLMEEVRAWMEAVRLKKTTFVGNSLGGAVGVLMALEHPEKIDRLIMLDPAGYPQKKPLVIRMASIPGSISAMKLIFGRWMVLEPEGGLLPSRLDNAGRHRCLLPPTQDRGSPRCPGLCDRGTRFRSLCYIYQAHIRDQAQDPHCMGQG
jgi:pimeloyl-ACP methyl ester carboxylesterase